MSCGNYLTITVSEVTFSLFLCFFYPYLHPCTGYYDEGLSAIIVFYGCNLPSRSREDYAYIMNHLFQ